MNDVWIQQYTSAETLSPFSLISAANPPAWEAKGDQTAP